jgi:toxin-antitoxin system PIN domain toxin
MITSEYALVDTNVLVYAADKTCPFHQSAKSLRDKAVAGKSSLCVCPQVLNEFFAVVTDPKRVGSPRSQEEALFEIEKYHRSKNILKIFPGPDVIEKTLDLLKRYNTTKQGIFDLHLVATMLSNNVTRLYTYNQDHFAKFNEIQPLTP